MSGALLFGCGLLMLSACASGGAGSAASPESSSGSSSDLPKVVDQAQWDEVLKAANKEGEVVVYGTLNAALATLVPQEFHKAYPEIKVTYVRLGPAEIEARLGAEIASGNIMADAFDNLQQTVVDGFAAKGALQPIAVPAVGAKDYNRDVNQRTPYSAFVSETVYGWAWNTKLLPNGIKSWDDYLKLDPALVGVTDPSIGPAVVSLYEAMEQPGTAGPGFLDKLMSKPANPRIFAGSNPLVTSLAAGEVAAALPIPVANVIAAKATGAPIEFALYANSYSIPTEVGLLKGPHANAAQVYANWLLSEGGQNTLAKTGVATVLPVPRLYDTKGIEFVRDKPLPQDKFVAFQQRWAKLLAS